jgi:hypothetical protein
MVRNRFVTNRKRILLIVVAALLLGTIGIVFAYNRHINPEISSTPASTSTIIASNTATSSATSSPTPTPHPAIVIANPQNQDDFGHSIGIAAGSQLTGLNDDDLNKELNGMATLGVTWVRFDVEWGFVQQNSPNQFDWSRYDRIINAIVAHHLKPLGIIAYTPPWARAPGCGGGSHCPPADPNTFATFAAEVAARYAPQGAHTWEIWNEPNDYDFWATKADCNAYTALLKTTYPAIKKADPASFVITGGLAQVPQTDVDTAPLNFLQCIYTQGGKGYFDAVADHPYTFPANPGDNTVNAWAQMSETTPSVRSIMIANGDANKKVWITEFGAPTNGPDPAWYVSEVNQSEMVVDTFLLYKTYIWAGPLFWYTYVDGSTSTSSNENFFGLTRPDGSTKPAYDVIKGLIPTI